MEEGINKGEVISHAASEIYNYNEVTQFSGVCGFESLLYCINLL